MAADKTYTDLKNQLSSDFWASPVIKGSDGKPYCPGFVGNTYASSMQDIVVFGDILKTPGIATVKVHRAHRADIKKVAGKDGARQTTLGVDLAEVEVQLEIWTPDQYDELKGLWSQIMPRSGKTDPNTYPIAHPTTKFHDVKQVLVLRGSGPDPGKVSRSRVFTIHCIEWIKQQTKSAVKTQVGAPPSLADPNANQNSITAARAYASAGSNTANTNP